MNDMVSGPERKATGYLGASTTPREAPADATAARVKIGRRPQRGNSKTTPWDRHRPDHYRVPK